MDAKKDKPGSPASLRDVVRAGLRLAQAELRTRPSAELARVAQKLQICDGILAELEPPSIVLDTVAESPNPAT